MPRYFTPDEANAVLEQVRPLVEQLVEHRRSQQRAHDTLRELEAKIAGNGGEIDAQGLADLTAAVDEARVAVAQCVNRIHGLGAIVKDLDSGLVDFPARYRGEEVLLCWRLPEPEIAFWHGLDEGFAGRKPLPFE